MAEVNKDSDDWRVGLASLLRRVDTIRDDKSSGVGLVQRARVALLGKRRGAMPVRAEGNMDNPSVEDGGDDGDVVESGEDVLLAALQLEIDRACRVASQALSDTQSETTALERARIDHLLGALYYVDQVCLGKV